MKALLKPKKSILYFSAAFLLIIIGSSFKLIFNNPLAPLYGIPIILLGIHVGKKGNRINNIENGKDENFEMQRPKWQIRLPLVVFLVAAVVVMYFSFTK